MANDFDSEALRKRLDAIILLLLESTGSGVDSTSAKIERLLDMGLGSADVAQIVGKTSNYVTTVAARKAKAKRKGAKK